jgi:hypothetical protein
MAVREDAPEYRQIKGLMAISAERLPFVARTRAGQLMKPAEPWRAHGWLDKMREIDRVERARDADPGMVEVFFTDGTTDLIGVKDLLCVERPILIEG